MNEYKALIVKGYPQKEIDMYEEIKKLYNSILKDIAELIKFYGYKGPLDISCFFDFMYQFNYLFASLNDSCENAADILEDPTIAGANVIAGGGVCRHNSNMLVDLLHMTRNDAMMVSGYITNGLVVDASPNATSKDCKMVPKINEVLKHAGSSNTILKEVKKKKLNYHIEKKCDTDYYEKICRKINHGIVLAGKEKKLFFDPTFGLFYQQEDDQLITLKHKSGTYYFLAFPEGGSSIEDFLAWMYGEDRTKKFHKMLKLPNYTDKEISERYNEIMCFLKGTKRRFEEFKRAHQRSMDEIRFKCLKLRYEEAKRVNAKLFK